MLDPPTPKVLDPAWDSDRRRFPLETAGATMTLFRECYNGQTLEAYSKKFGCTIWMLLPCNQWSCRKCAEKKIATLAAKTQKAEPNRLLTLTIDPSLWPDPRASFDGTRRQVPELIRKLRLKFGDVEYLRVTELTRNGWPHYHLLVRSGYLPQPVVKELWALLTGATIVDLRQVKNRFQTYIYLVKYLSKMHKLEWTTRHVSTSRKFFPPADDSKSNSLQLESKKVIESSPGRYLFTMFRGASLVEVSHGVWALGPPLPGTQPPDPTPELESQPGSSEAQLSFDECGET